MGFLDDGYNLIVGSNVGLALVLPNNKVIKIWLRTTLVDISGPTMRRVSRGVCSLGHASGAGVSSWC